MSLNVAVVMDPIECINIAGDSTFGLLLEARARGHRVDYLTPDKLSLDRDRAIAPVRSLEVRDTVGDHFSLGEERRTDLAEYDVVLMRNDPPFDLAYITVTHILERVHPKTLVVNDPIEVRNAPEKLLVTYFPELMPATLITRDIPEIKRFREEHGDIVIKPLYGNAGAAVFLIHRDDRNFGSFCDFFAASFREPWVVQKFLPKVSAGDKRIILVDGVAAGALNRVPAADDLRSNLARGAKGEATEMTAREKEICAIIGPELKKRGLIFVGIDVIDGYLTEINVTSPTGIRGIQKLGGPNVAGTIWDAIEAKRRG